MTTYYLSAGGSATSPYDTWAKAATTIAQINALNPANGSHTVYLRPGDSFSDTTLDLASWANSYTTITIEGIDGDGQTLASDGKPIIVTDTNQGLDLTDSGVNWVLKNFKLNEGGPTEWMAEILNSGSITIDGLDWDSSTGASPNNPHGVYIQDFTGAVEIKNCTAKGYLDTGQLSTDRHVLAIRQSDGNGSNHGNNTVKIFDNNFSEAHADLIMFYNIKSAAGYEAEIYKNVFTTFSENGIDCKGSQRLKIYKNEFISENRQRKSGAGGSGHVNINNADTLVTDDVFCEYIWVYGNDLGPNYDNSGTYYTGITVNPQASGGYVYIYGNRITDCAPHVSLQTGQYVYFFSNVLHQETNPTDTPFSRDECFIQFYGGTNVEVHNNSIYQDTDVAAWSYGIYFHSTFSGGASAVVKNNLIYMTRTGDECLYIDSSVTGTPTIDNNTYYNDQATNLIYDKGSTYAAADFGGGAGDWNNSAGSHPADENRQSDYVGKASGDLTLPSGSSEVDDGEDLGDTFDEGLSSAQTDFSTSPPTVVLVDRDTYTWDRGAYEYISDIINVPVSELALILAINQATASTGSAGAGIVNTVNLVLAAKGLAGFNTVAEVNAISLTLSLKQLAGAIPPEVSDWLKSRLDDWIIDFAA